MKMVPALLALFAILPGSVSAQPLLQCAPYARDRAGIAIHGNAATWWDQAAGSYDRGQAPAAGAVLVFKATRSNPYGHVAVVDRVVDDRHVMLDHANWSRPGKIEHDALAEDVSEAGDWSQVRVWYAPIAGMGLRSNAAFGFIYSPSRASASRPELARNDVGTKIPG
jgi:hypothetical protein